MPVIVNITISRYEDAVLTIGLEPPTPVGGHTIQFQTLRAFGGVSGLINKYVASGLNNQSGINITNSGQGIFNVRINELDTSGWNYGNYAYQVKRLDSGFATVYTEGFINLVP